MVEWEEALRMVAGLDLMNHDVGIFHRATLLVCFDVMGAWMKCLP